MVQVFKKELDAGLGDKIQQDTSIAFVLEAKTIEVSEQDFIKSIALVNNIEKQIDLFYFESILVSTGWNKNDDVFDKAELWAAKSTPVNKKINFMHNEKDIIGHMISSRIVDRDNKEIGYDTPDIQIPNEFDIIVGGVLYTIWENPELQLRMDEMISSIGMGKWKVSMECVYPHFDYAIITPDNQHKIIPRNEQTSFLTKHLRRYGGTGSFENFRIGRLLRKMVFSGKGVVDEPANPRSNIIKTEYSEFLGTAASVENLSITEKSIMPDVITYTKEQYDELKAKYEKSEAAAKLAAEESMTNKVKQFETTIANLNTDLSASKEIVKAHETKVASLEKEITELKTSLTKANDELTNVKKDALKANRLAMFNDIDIEAAKAEELVNKFIDTSDEMFAELVKAMPKKKKEEKKEDTSSAKDASDALAKAKVEDGGAIPNTDTKKADTLASAKAWLANSFKSSKKKGE